LQRSSIEKVMKIELSSGLMKFVTGPFEKGAAVEESGSRQKNEEVDAEKFEQLMAPLFVGLVRIGKLEEYLEAYREALVRKVKQMIKNKAEEMVDGLLGSASDSTLSLTAMQQSDTTGGGSLVQQLRELSSDSFLAVMSSIFEILLGIIEQLQRVNAQTDKILRQLQTSGQEESALFSKELVDRVMVSSQELVFSVHELAHIRCAKLLEIRKEVNLSSPIRVCLPFCLV